MATRDSTADCSLPELLVRDLEDLDGVFASKLMTADYRSLDISASLAGGDSDSRSIQGLDIPRHPTPYRPSASRTRPHSSVDKDTRADMFDGDKSDFLAEFSDSSSDESADMGSPVVRTREQSFTTAATSVSGRCSSILSKPISPSSRASSQLGRARQGTWFDAEVDEDTSTNSSPDPNNTEILDKPVAPCPLSALGFITLNTREPVLSLLSPDLRPTTATHRPIHAVTTDKRPHTASGHPRIGRPRLVDIQPPLAVPKRRSSLKKTHQHVGFFSAISFGDAGDAVEDATLFRGPLNSNPIIPMLATSCGRTVIDASKPPSLDFSDQSQPARSVHNNRTSLLNVADGFMFDDQESEDEVSYAEASPSHSHGRKLSLATLDSWGSFRPASLSPLIANPTTSAGSALGIPLPPDVVETLRVSIACFPETMLLSSSLSIEMIRSYSRKLRHRSTPSHRLSEDNQSVFSFSSCSAKSTSRWGLPRLLQSRSTKNYATSLTTMPEQAVSAPQMPVTPYWTPIKNIFPNGSDYLCDALYAHIVAYNYVNVLCPPLPVAPPRTSVMGASKEITAKIPSKAASLLGLQSGTPHLAPSAPSAPASGYGDDRTSLPFRRSHSGFGLGLTSKPRRSGSTSEPAALRDVQVGLGRCISFLAATLKRLGEVPTEDENMVLQSEKEAVDPLLIRALCEAVRCSEEAISA